MAKLVEKPKTETQLIDHDALVQAERNEIHRLQNVRNRIVNRYRPGRALRTWLINVKIGRAIARLNALSIYSMY